MDILFYTCLYNNNLATVIQKQEHQWLDTDNSKCVLLLIGMGCDINIQIIRGRWEWWQQRRTLKQPGVSVPVV